MKFSLPLLFFLAFIVAVEMRLRKTHDLDPTLAVAGLYLLLTWSWLSGSLRLTSNNRKVTKLNNFFVGACVSGGAYALYRMFFPRVASISQIVSVESLLILSTLILANNAVFATPRKGSHWRDGAGTYQSQRCMLCDIKCYRICPYCAADRSKPCNKTDAQQLWKNRLRGLAMLAPFIWLFVDVTHFLLEIGGGRLPRLDSMIWSMLLTDPRPFLLASLLLMGVRTIANASNYPTFCLPLPQTDLAQLVCIAFILVVLLPMQLAAFQFYFNAVLTLQP